MHRNLIVNIFGPSTSGKSTVADLIHERIDRLYTVDFDVIKRQISGYYWKRDSQTAQDITLDTLASATKAGLQILALLPPPKTKADYDRLAAIAETAGYKVLNVEITAPDDVLIERYTTRMEQVRTSGSQWKFKTPEEFKSTLQAGYFRPQGSHTFDSGALDPQAILDGVMELISHG